MKGVQSMAVQLFTRSHFSLLNGLMSIDNLLQQAKENGFSAVALTDYHALHGALEFYKKAPHYGIKAIFGLEVSVDDYQLVLIAKDNKGMQTLHRLSYLLSKQRTISFNDFKYEQAHLIIILPSEKGPFEAAIYEENDDEVHHIFKLFKQELSDFYLGITHQESKFFQKSNAYLRNIALAYDIKTVAMPKVYYQKKEDHHAFRALRAIDTQKLMSDSSLTFAPDRHFLTMDELKLLYDKECIQQANDIADLCHVDLQQMKTTLPQFENNYGVENSVFLENLSKKGLEKRLNKTPPKAYIDRLNHELNIITSMGFTDYFLIVYDVIRFAKIKGINVGPGRGSAAGSLVSYSLGITEVDPLVYNLMFERFLNPQRQSMPDIDIDFPDDRRDEVVQYAISKYGEDHVTHIVAFGSLRARQSFRDCARILNIPTYTVNQVAKMINYETLMATYQNNKSFALSINTSKELSEVFNLALKLEGKPRHLTLHAAGIVASKKPLLDVIPVVYLEGNVNATQYDMSNLEDLGLIKIDFLGLRNLSIIDRIAQDIRKENPVFSIQQIPLDDKKTFEVLAKGETTGIFQLESSEMRNLLRKLKPTRFLDIVDTIALYRPGPMENIPTYLENRDQPQNIDYLHEDLKAITQSTYGILIYQEQIMEVAQKFAGFTLAKADILRRAMSAKDAKSLKGLEAEFKQGAIELGHSEALSNRIFALIYKFADYGFNKSHSVAYSMVAYQLAYLKANYSDIFYTELLNSVIGAESKTKLYIDECQRLSVKLEVPSLNTSDVIYKRHLDLIRLPLSLIKGISKTTAQKIVQERKDNGFYRSYTDAVVRLRMLKINEGQINVLIDSGTFDIFDLSRETMKHNLQEVLLYANLVSIEDKDGQIVFDYGLVSEPKLSFVSSNKKITLANEFAALGFYLSDYPTRMLKERYQTAAIYQLVPAQKPYRVIAKVDRIKEHRAKNGKLMAFLAISDDSGNMDAIMFNNVYERFKDKFSVDDLVLIKGNVKEEGSILISDFHVFDD